MRKIPSSNYFRLFLCGAVILFWELTMIRWFGTHIRVVAYFTNFVLMAAFLGLGAGSLLARFRPNYYRWIFPLLTGCLLLGSLLGTYSYLNPNSPDEYIWIGYPKGIFFSENLSNAAASMLPAWLVLAVVYVSTVLVFTLLGQLLGKLFIAATYPLKAYSMEITGSLAGIFLFALMSAFRLPPVYWMGLGCFLLLLLLARELGKLQMLLAMVSVPLLVFLAFLTSSGFTWSPYYKIFAKPLFQVFDYDKKEVCTFTQPVGIGLTVNSDYHQMIVNLKPRGEDEHDFFKSWRALYDLPYEGSRALPPGPVLIVGAGTGNDVAAALRNTGRDIVAVEIDPVIIKIGRACHFEAPYSDPRVTVVVDDARSYLQQTQQHFAIVVFGFLDSHTLLSSFSTLRLDNFIYTQECMRKVREVLAPGGKVSITFAANRDWIDQRIQALLQKEFGGETTVSPSPYGRFANGTVYINYKRSGNIPGAPAEKAAGAIDVPTDDWPFLYLQTKTIPRHYRFFMALIAGLGFLPLLLLPKGSRSIRFPYFFMGAAFFLIETSNVVTLSLLYGSTWTVNVWVFGGILFLILMGNATSPFMKRAPMALLFALLALSICTAYAIPVSMLLGMHSGILRTIAAVLVYLGPIYFAGTIFALLISNEQNLYQAYGSNLLGAVLGGACEYLSMIFGFKFLLLLTLVFYGLAFVCILRKGIPNPESPTRV